MGQGVLDGLLLVLQPESLLYLTIGMAIGLLIGFLPGLGGLATLALLTPLIIGMDPAPGLSFILGAYGACSFGGSGSVARVAEVSHRPIRVRESHFFTEEHS